MTEKKAKSLSGEIGEEIAARFLVGRGYKIIERNYRKPWGEIDIIAGIGSTIRFIEVKTVSRENAEFLSGYRPEDNVHPAKIKRIHRALQTYLEEKKEEDSHWQIDLVTVVLSPATKRAKVNYIESIF